MHPLELAFWIIFAAIFGYVIFGFIRVFFPDRSFPSPRGTTRHSAGGAFGESTGVDTTGVSTSTFTSSSDVSFESSSDVSSDSGGGDSGGDFSGGGGDSGGGGASGGWND